MKILLILSRNIGFELVDGKMMVIQNHITSMDTKIHLDNGAKLFKKDNFDYIFCVGGLYLPETFQTKPASMLMKEYLIEKYGINDKKILIEERSVDTTENVIEMIKVLDKHKINIKNVEIKVVSYFLHNIRVGRILKHFGAKKVDYFNLYYRIPVKLFFIEVLSIVLNFFDPEGKSPISMKEKATRKNRKLSNILKNYY